MPTAELYAMKAGIDDFAADRLHTGVESRAFCILESPLAVLEAWFLEPLQRLANRPHLTPN